MRDRETQRFLVDDDDDDDDDAHATLAKYKGKESLGERREAVATKRAPISAPVEFEDRKRKVDTRADLYDYEWLTFEYYGDFFDERSNTELCPPRVTTAII